MPDCLLHFVGGEWITPVGGGRLAKIENPASEEIIGYVAVGDECDVDRAVAAARAAFPAWARSSIGERIDLLSSIAEAYRRRAPDLADAVTAEIGAPAALARTAHVSGGLDNIEVARDRLPGFAFEERDGDTLIRREPVGVCALITPWNWPLNQISCKVVPAIATGCTMVLKPAEIAPSCAAIFAEIMADAGTPPGVFNLVHGEGKRVGSALARHVDVDMVSFTGSTRAGIEVAIDAAPTVKRVTQELGGKSAMLLLDDRAMLENVGYCVERMMLNSGQSCNAPSRLLVPQSRLSEAAAAARKAAEHIIVADPRGKSDMGPVVSREQFDKIQGSIERAMAAGAALVAGGLGRPAGMDRGYYVRPTIFSHVSPAMEVAREEVFGPVLAIIGYGDIDEAIRIANDSDYGLAAYICGEDQSAIRRIADQLRVGQVRINGASADRAAPFGGYKRSGNGRERGTFAFHDYLEIKSILGSGLRD